MEKLEKLKELELQDLSSLWGGTADCKKMTAYTIYTNGCENDGSCWECDDPVV